MKVVNKLFLFICIFVAYFPLQICAQSVFSPTSLSGLKLWFVGDSCHLAATLEIDTIYDLSGNQNHGIQPVPSLRPQTSANTLNGHKAYQFDGVDDYVEFAAINDIRTVFWVIKERANATPNYRALLGHDNQYHFYRPTLSFWDNSFSDNGIRTGITHLNFNIVNGITTNVPSEFSVIDLVTTNNVFAKNFSIDRNIGGRVWDGELAELIIYNQPLTPAEVITVQDYLNNKYTQSILLPADITVVKSFCDTTLVPQGDFVSYQWSTGAATNTISVDQSGKYWINATNIFGKVSSDTIVVNFPDYHKPLQNYICSGNTLLWDTFLDKNDYTFQWQDNSLDSVFVITQPGNYYVKITDSFGCNITTDSLKITEDNFSNITSLGPDRPICSGNTITLTSGLSSSNSYTWSTGSNNDSLLITNAGQYSIIVTNTNNCVANDTINIAIQGQAPIANFSSNIGCVNQTLSFTDLSIPPSGNSISNYDWSFGDTSSPTNTATASNPSHTYANTGTYTVNLTVTTSSNCSQSITKTINVYPVPTASFISGNSCQNDSTAFINQSTSTSGYSLTSSFWNFGDVGPNSTSVLSNPKHVFTNQGTYSVVLLATNNVGCSSTDTNSVFVKAEVSANFTYSPPCTNYPTLFQSTSIAPLGNTTYSWTFGSSSSTLMNPTKTYTNSGVYTVTFHVDGGNGCTSTISKLINVYLPPVLSFTIPSFCSKDTITAINLSNAQSGVMSSYNWKLNTNLFSTVQSPTLSLTPANTYSVRLTVVNSFSCKDSVTKSFTVYPLPLVDFTTMPSGFYYVNESVIFNPSVTNASAYQWDITGVPTKTAQSINQTFNTEGSYTVSLNLKDQQGCRNSKTKNITVSKRYLDLAILNVSTLKDNDGFMTVIADLANYGSVPISTIDMHYRISDAGNVKETWNGTLSPNSFYTYTFLSKSASEQNSSNNITCVEIEKVNAVVDENINNNSFCNSLNINDISVSNPLPNPAAGDIILPITLNRDMEYTISIYNSLGQLQQDETTKKGLAGLNFVPLSTSVYARGSYIIKVMIDGKIFIKKFIKIDNQ